MRKRGREIERKRVLLLHSTAAVHVSTMYAGTSTRLETQYPGLYSLLLETFLVCLGNDVALRRHKQGVAGPLTCGV